ncbi:hypothetical protein [Hymenobacter weizhouensis]|uniref:hypothetical protein n=1 Tax=Hymenobacter sp. YIM 151500-1 TaxID=2987689 RepID=UPI0022263C5A|nr:hypothetical protein [Hymenobacter sp. YIM 151500-1]UYZ65050.1 hypothetical protein OIS53_09400 [Hymenobacter sp. YIM 151500-1]
MPDDYLAYQTFPDPAVAQPLRELLDQHQIPHEARWERPDFDVTFAHNPTSRRFLVLVRPDDFEKARALEEEASRQLTAAAPPDHYLRTFTDNELLDVLARPDEWSAFDVALGQELLHQRGHDVSDGVLALLHQQRLRELARPEPRQRVWVSIGYVLALLGGVLGILIGWHLSSHHKTLPDGRRVPSFAEEDRRHGRRMLGLGIGCGLLWLGWRLYARLAGTL